MHRSPLRRQRQAPHSVASELLVNDRTLVMPAPPLAIATANDVVWIACSDGNVEVRNSRTGEVVRRFEPAVSVATAAAPGATGAAGLLANVTNRRTAASGGGGGATGVLRRLGNKEAASPAPSGPVIVRALLAVPTVEGDYHVWMGLSNGCIEVHDGGVLPGSAAETAVGAKGRAVFGGLVALLRRHTAAVTSLAEFGGFVYSGGEDRRVLQWRASHTAYVRIFSSSSPHEGPVRCLYAEGNALVSGADDCTVKVWDIGEGAMRLTGYFHSQSGGVLALCRVGEHMWSGDASGQVVRWHLRTCEAVGIHVPHSSRVLSLCRVGDRVYSGSADGTMGIFDAGTGLLLQHITDQVLGWVTAVECPAELSRFVVWSASADGAVRCWYQDEYTSMAADAMRFNDATWYLSGSTPYREFRAAVAQRMQRLKQQLDGIEHRDKHAMSLLCRCSSAFGGGGAALEGQQLRLQDQLAQLEHRCRGAEERMEARRMSLAQMDRDIATTLALLQNTRSELNLVAPGEAERVLATMPGVTTEDLVAYNPSSAAAMLGSAAGATDAAGAPAGAGDAGAGVGGVGGVPPSTALGAGAATALPGSLPPSATAPPPAATYATSTVQPLGLPAPLGPVPPPPVPPPAGVPPPPPGVAVPAPALSLPPAMGAGVPLPGANVPLPPPAATLSTLGVGGALGGAAPPLGAPPVPPPPGVGGVPGADGVAGGAAGAVAGGSAGVPQPSAGVLLPGQPAAGGAPEGSAPGTGAAAGTADGAAAGAAAGVAGSRKKGGGASGTAGFDDGISWTNPHVGNYIQRRYYGASPSLRTTDLMKEERRRGRLPRVKVVPLERERSRSPSGAPRAASASGAARTGSTTSAAAGERKPTSASAAA